MSVSIKKCTVEEFLEEQNSFDLLDAYADELAMEGLPHPKAKLDMYRQLESLGKLQIITAYMENFLIGFVNVITVMNPHYGIDISSTESFFVLKEFRKSGAGVLLRREAELCAKRLNSPGIFISAPFGSNLAASLEGSKDYKETGRTFFKGFANV